MTILVVQDCSVSLLIPAQQAQDIKGVVSPVWRLGPSKIPTEPILAAQKVSAQGPWVKGQGTAPE